MRRRLVPVALLPLLLAACSGGGESVPVGGGGDGGGDGGSASNPGKVTCGAAECSVDTQICCRFFDGGTACNAGNNCPGGGGTTELECDEKADCQGGDLCCQGFGGGTECKSGCGNFETAICKSNAECADGGTCKQWACPGNVTVRSCTMPFQGCN